MIILGIHSGHDGGAAVVKDGRILSAVNEERITRNKMVFGVPYKAIPEALRCAGITPGDVDEIAVESIAKPGGLVSHGRPWLQKVMLTGGRALLDFFFIRGKQLKCVYGLRAVPFNLLAVTGLPRWLMTDALAYLYLRRVFGFRPRITWISHHEAHRASAYYTGNVQDALSVTIEEYDGRNAMAMDMVRDGQSTRVAASPYPHSPGVFYALITRMLGYNQMIHCGKVTGLAAYADPRKAYAKVEKLMWSEGMEVRVSPLVYQLTVEYARTGKIPAYFEDFTPAELSSAFQQRLEDTIVPIVTRAVAQTGAQNVVLSGGVVANVKLNQRILAIPGVRCVFVHPGMSDTGTGLGAALSLAAKRVPLKPFRLPDVFLGHEVTDDEIAGELERLGLRYTREQDIAGKIASLLRDKRIVIRVRGKMEYGPRALGNRSILYHCDDPSINGWLNKRLRRTEFMPFAPAVLADHADKCFVNYRGAEYAAEFMTITCDCTPWMKQHCPAVVHLDGTARPQLVTPSSNPDFHAILTRYYELTGIPVLINTSYNIHNEPIVMTAADSLRVFKETCLDYIALNDFLVSAKENNLVWKGDREPQDARDIG